MNLTRLWCFLAVALPVLAAVIAPMSAIDLTYHLRAGNEILATGAVPTVDTWTFTIAGQPWVDQQWAAQVILAIAERSGGWTGLVLLRAALTGIIFASLLVIALRRGVGARGAALLTLVAFFVAAPAMALRPQLFGMACFALVLVLIADRRAQPVRLWLVPVVIALWANMHGSFFLGPAALVLAWLEDVHDRVPRRHTTLAVAVVASLAACLTPFGPFVWAYAIGLSSNPTLTSRVTEWQPTTIRDVTGAVFYLSVAAVGTLIARGGSKVPWPTLAWIAAFAAVGMFAQRGVAWWPLAAIIPVAGLLGSPVPIVRGEAAGSPRINLAVVALLVAAAIVALPIWRPIDTRTGVPEGVLTDAPPGVTEALRSLAGPGDHVLNPQRWGSWFEYAVPDILVATDSRIEILPPAVWERVEAIAAGRDGWETTLEDWDVRFIVLDAGEDAAAARLKAAGWEAAFADDDGTILRRPGG